MSTIDRLSLIALSCAIFGLLTVWSGCSDHPRAPELAEVPAALTAHDLSLRETAATVAAVDAAAKGDASEAAHQRALATELGKLRADAEHRATAERAELATITAQQNADAQALSDRHQRDTDRRWAMGLAGLGIALSVAAAGLLLWWGIPRQFAIGVPGAVIAACLVGSAWFAAGDYLLITLGCLAILAVLAIAGLAVWVALHLVREWQHYAAAAAEPTMTERHTLDEASVARQPAIIRWLIDHLLARHPISPASTP